MAASPTASRSDRMDRVRDLRKRGRGGLSRGRQRHSGARRLRRARHGGQDPSGQIRARTRACRIFGICFGMQMAVIEAARNLAGIRGREFDRIRRDARAGRRADDRVDARQRARAAPAGRRSRRHDAAGRLRRRLAEGSRVAEIYGTTRSRERHRHRYEVNIGYRARLRSTGFVFPGCRRTACCPRSIEFPDHPWFIGVQFHPELKSRPFDPHPLFASFIGAAVEQSRLV